MRTCHFARSFVNIFSSSYTSNDHYTSVTTNIDSIQFIFVIKIQLISSCSMNSSSFSMLDNKQLSTSCRDDRSQESARAKEKLIRCHCFGTNLALVYNLRYSSSFCSYPVVIFIFYSYENNLRRCRLLFIDARR